MTISVTDTNTGQALTVTAVQAELARLDPPTSFSRLYTNDLSAINTRLGEDVAHTLLSAAAELRALANDLAGGRWTYQMEIKVEPVPVFADLPPDPALQLAPDVLDAEQVARDERAEVLRRQKVLAPVGQREQVWSEKTTPFVPKVPWQIRVKRAVVAVLQRDAEERAL